MIRTQGTKVHSHTFRWSNYIWVLMRPLSIINTEPPSRVPDLFLIVLHCWKFAELLCWINSYQLRSHSLPILSFMHVLSLLVAIKTSFIFYPFLGRQRRQLLGRHRQSNYSKLIAAITYAWLKRSEMKLDVHVKLKDNLKFKSYFNDQPKAMESHSRVICLWFVLCKTVHPDSSQSNWHWSRAHKHWTK